MKQDKTTMIVLGCLGVLCLCGVVVAVAGAGYYFYNGSPADSASAQATIAPEKIPTRLPAMTPTASTGSAQPESVPEDTPPTDNADAASALDALSRISVLPFSYDENEDGLDDGIAIDFVFYDAADEVITFDGVPINITLEFYVFTDFLESSEIENGEMIYTETFVRDHSATLAEMFTNYIRIPYSDVRVDASRYIRFGMVRAIVETPNGTFETTSVLVMMYPEME